MPARLRRDLEILRIEPQRFVLRDTASGEAFEFGQQERFLVGLLDGEHTAAEICEAYRDRFGEPLSRRYVEEFVEQLREAGLLEGAEPLPAAVTPSEPPRELVPTPTRDPVGRLNHFFDLLAVAFGWAVHPICLLPLALLAWCAAGVAIHRWSSLIDDLTAVGTGIPLLVLAFIWLVQMTLCISLPGTLLAGIACRVLGGRIYAFRLEFYHRTIPYFHCDMGDSFVRMSPRGRWTVLTLGIWWHLFVASVALLGWAMARHQVGLRTALLLLVIPSVARLILRLNPFIPLEAYAVLCYQFEEFDLMSRARAETWSWLSLRRSHEALTPSERLWFRAFGLGYYAWRLVIHSVLLVGGGWLLIGRLRGLGAVIGILLLIWWYSDVIGRSLMASSTFRWLTRAGGRWYIRWPFRIAVVGGIVALGFIPYQHEVGGDFRLLPAKELGVRAPIASDIAQVQVHAGEMIDAGQPLVVLAAREQLAKVETTEAELKSAKAELALLEAGNRQEKIEAARQQVELAQTRLDYHATELRRAELLAGTNTATDAQLATARFQRDSAEKLLAAAREELAELEAGARDEQIAAAQAEIERLEAMLKHYRKELDLADVSAPVTGRVVTLGIETREGQYVQPGDLIAVLQDDSHLQIEIAATEDAVVWIRQGQDVKLRFWGLDGELLMAKVIAAASTTVDRGEIKSDRFRTDRERRAEQPLRTDESRYISVFAELDQTHEGLVPGMTGYARIVVGPDTFWGAVARPVLRFFRVEVWSWLP